MVVTQGCCCPSEGSSSGYGVGPFDDHMQEFFLLEITRSILEQTPVIFGTIKEGIMEVLDERLGAFHTEMVAMVDARSLTF